jgi:hypothetical protein
MLQMQMLISDKDSKDPKDIFLQSNKNQASASKHLKIIAGFVCTNSHERTSPMALFNAPPPTAVPTSTSNTSIDDAIKKLGDANTAAAVLSVNTSIAVIAAKAVGDALKNVR